MTPKTYREIKEISKIRVNDRFGDALLIILIPALGVSIISLFTNYLTGFFDVSSQFISNYIIRRILTILATYVSIFMIVKFARGRNGFTTEGLFDDTKRIIHFIIYYIIAGIIWLLALIPLLDYIIEMYPLITSSTDPNTVAAYIREYMESNPSILGDFWLSILISFITSLIMVKFRFTPFIITDSKFTVFKAMKKSWTLTNGNYFRVLFFPFTFILWALFAIITCGLGLIYFLPLFQTGQAYLYLTILTEASGNSDTYIEKVIPKTVKEDPLNVY
jgi:uncharacterized membrane protein